MSLATLNRCVPEAVTISTVRFASVRPTSFSFSGGRTPRARPARSGANLSRRRSAESLARYSRDFGAGGGEGGAIGAAADGAAPASGEPPAGTVFATLAAVPASLAAATPPSGGEVLATAGGGGGGFSNWRIQVVSRGGMTSTTRRSSSYFK